MKISLILGHPRRDSFNHAIAQTAAAALTRSGHEVNVHDLYEEHFDPVLPFREIPKGASLNPLLYSHCKEISEAGGIVIVHPNWWGQPPAILKGWVDRVIRPGVAYRFSDGDSGEGIPDGLFRGKTALVFNTTDTPAEREMQVFGDPLETLWKNCIFGFCGVEEFSRRTYGVIVTSTDEQRKAWLEDVKETVGAVFGSGS